MDEHALHVYELTQIIINQKSKTMKDYCRNCDSEQIEERIADIKNENIRFRDYDDSDIQEMFEEEIGLCYDCQKEDDADDYKGEGWD
jgi:hypothetical protein